MSAQPVVPETAVSGAPASAPVETGLPDASAPRQATPIPDAVSIARAGSARQAIRGLFALALVATLYAGRSFLLPVLIAVLLSLLLAPPVAVLERLRIPRALGALVVVGAVLAGVAGFALHLTAPAQHWFDAGPERVDELRRKLRMLRAPVDKVRGATERVAEIAAEPPAERPREVVLARRFTTELVEHAQPVAVGVLSVVILLYFLLASGDLFLRKLIRVTPRLRDKIRAIEISRTVQHRIGRYFASITLINAGLGVVVAATMALLGMPTPVLLGTLCALLNFVPYLGPLMALLMLSLVSIVSFDTVGMIVLPPALFLAITTLEGQVVQPIVLGRQLSTTAVAMFLWVLFWGWLWGFAGVAVAVPLLVAVKICAEHLPAWQPLAEFLGRD